MAYTLNVTPPRPPAACQNTLAEISDKLEASVLEASRSVQTGIGGVDKRIADIFAELNQDLWLVTKDHHYGEK